MTAELKKLAALSRSEALELLRQACTRGDSCQLKSILTSGLDAHLADEASGASLLRVCAERGHAECFQLLLQAGLDPNVTDGDGRTPLAVAAGLLARPELLERQSPATAVSAKAGAMKIIALLQSTTQEPSFEAQPTACAAKRRPAPAFHRLEERASDREDKPSKKQQRKGAGKGGGGDEEKAAAQNATHQGAAGGIGVESGLLEAAQALRPEELRARLREGGRAEANRRIQPNGWAPFHALANAPAAALPADEPAGEFGAAHRGWIPGGSDAALATEQCVDVLLEHGADPWQLDADGRSVLWHAARRGNAALIAALARCPGTPAPPTAVLAQALAEARQRHTVAVLAALSDLVRLHSIGASVRPPGRGAARSAEGGAAGGSGRGSADAAGLVRMEALVAGEEESPFQLRSETHLPSKVGSSSNTTPTASPPDASRGARLDAPSCGAASSEAGAPADAPRASTPSSSSPACLALHRPGSASSAVLEAALPPRPPRAAAAAAPAMPPRSAAAPCLPEKRSSRQQEGAAGAQRAGPGAAGPGKHSRSSGGGKRAGSESAAGSGCGNGVLDAPVPQPLPAPARGHTTSASGRSARSSGSGASAKAGSCAAARGKRYKHSRYIGVTKQQNGKWVAQIAIEGTTKCLGMYNEEDAAALAFDAAAQLIRGRNANLNFKHKDAFQELQAEHPAAARTLLDRLPEEHVKTLLTRTAAAQRQSGSGDGGRAGSGMWLQGSLPAVEALEALLAQSSAPHPCRSGCEQELPQQQQPPPQPQQQQQQQQGGADAQHGAASQLLRSAGSSELCLPALDDAWGWPDAAAAAAAAASAGVYGRTIARLHTVPTPAWLGDAGGYEDALPDGRAHMRPAPGSRRPRPGARAALEAQRLRRAASQPYALPAAADGAVEPAGLAYRPVQHGAAAREAEMDGDAALLCRESLRRSAHRNALARHDAAAGVVESAAWMPPPPRGLAWMPHEAHAPLGSAPLQAGWRHASGAVGQAAAQRLLQPHAPIGDAPPDGTAAQLKLLLSALLQKEAAAAAAADGSASCAGRSLGCGGGTADALTSLLLQQQMPEVAAAFAGHAGGRNGVGWGEMESLTRGEAAGAMSEAQRLGLLSPDSGGDGLLAGPGPDAEGPLRPMLKPVSAQHGSRNAAAGVVSGCASQLMLRMDLARNLRAARTAGSSGASSGSGRAGGSRAAGAHALSADSQRSETEEEDVRGGAAAAASSRKAAETAPARCGRGGGGGGGGGGGSGGGKRGSSGEDGFWNPKREQQSAKRRKLSRYCGVTKQQNGKWVAQIPIEGRTRFLGMFATEETAALAFDLSARIIRGPDTRVNFKDTDPTERLAPETLRAVLKKIPEHFLVSPSGHMPAGLRRLPDTRAERAGSGPRPGRSDGSPAATESDDAQPAGAGAGAHSDNYDDGVGGGGSNTPLSMEAVPAGGGGGGSSSSSSQGGGREGPSRATAVAAEPQFSRAGVRAGNRRKPPKPQRLTTGL